ncbi:MAG: diguanylate cyclase [Mobilicoccus sp.]|nr:diguanylate cyclase [Mobilicoccus sp.]
MTDAHRPDAVATPPPTPWAGVAGERRWRRVVPVVWIAFALIAATMVTFRGDVARSGYAFVVGSCMIAMALGPHLRGARPRVIWYTTTLAALLMAPSAVRFWTPWKIGPFEFGDAFVLPATIALLTWGIMLLRASRTHVWVSILDSGAATTSTVLLLWVVLFAPLRDDGRLVSDVLWSLYPALDLAFAVVLVLLRLRLRRCPAPLGWLALTAALWLILDLSYLVLPEQIPDAAGVTIDILDLTPHLTLALAFCHPRVHELVPPPPRRGERRAWGRGAFMGIVMTPVIIALALDDASDLDRQLRAGLIAILLALLIARLAHMMWSLARAGHDLQEQARRDPLTGLLNRGAMIQAIEEHLERDRARGRATVLLFLDCDDFKKVNDTWGHHAGDTLLIDLAERLRAVIPDGVVARHGGDEFVVLTSVTSAQEARAVAERVHGVCRTPLAIGPRRTHPLTPSVGVATVWPDDECSVAEVLTRADMAMYEAKRLGKGRVVHLDESLAAASRRDAAVGDHLDRRLRDVGVDLHPILATSIVGFRARIRWQDEEVGEVPPDVFVPVADDLGLGVDLVVNVLERACSDLAERHADHPEAFVVVDVTRAQVTDTGFVARVAAVVRASDVPPEAVWLAVPESVLAGTPTPILPTLSALRDLGVRVCLAGFGTGDASVTTLVQTQCDAVRIDASLVVDVDHDEGARQRLSAILEFVRSLDTPCILAEATDAAQAATLIDLGCDAVCLDAVPSRPSTH